MRSTVGMTAFLPASASSPRFLAEFVGLLHVGFGGDVAGGALQVVGHGPVEFVAQSFFDHVGDHGCCAAELGVAKGVFAALFGQKRAVGVVAAFGDDDGAVAVFFDQLVHAGEEFLLVKHDFREQDDDGDAVVFDQTAGSGDPAGVAAHDFEHEDFGGGFAHGAHVKRGFQRRHGDVFGDRAKAGAAVGDRQVVVHGFGHVDGLQRVVHGFGQLADLEAGVRRVATAVVEKVADVVGFEDFDQALVFDLVGFQRLELEAARAKRTRWRLAQRGDVAGGFFAGVDQVFGQRADDAVATGIHLADFVFVQTRGFNHAAGRGVDDRGDAAGLGVEGVHFFDWAL